MSAFHIRTFVPDDIPQIMAVQQAYQRLYAHASVVPGEVYLSPAFENGSNIFCACDQHERLQGYAPLMPNLTAEPELPNVIWTEVKTDPSLPAAKGIKDALFDRVLARTWEIIRTSPGKPAQLTFQYHPSEAASIDYVLSKSFVHAATVFRMMRDLSREIPLLPQPEGIDVRLWRMETVREQQAYIRARNEAFPDAPASLADWQAFLQSSLWNDGTSVTAFEGQTVVGSVTTYCDDALSQYTGNRAGITEYIFIKPGWRGRGIAAHLICESLRFLKARGRDAAYLEVKATNECALSLYRRLGYEVIDETRLYALELAAEPSSAAL